MFRRQIQTVEPPTTCERRLPLLDQWPNLKISLFGARGHLPPFFFWQDLEIIEFHFSRNLEISLSLTVWLVESRKVALAK